MKPLAALVLLIALLATSWKAQAAATPMDDEELSNVTGQDGVSIVVHLELSSFLLNGGTGGASLVAGFKVNGVTTYAVLQDLGGVVDMFGINLDIRQRPDASGTYLDLGLPNYVAFNHFGFRALGAQQDPSVPVTPQTSYGQVLLNGSATTTGHVYIWAQ